MLFNRIKEAISGPNIPECLSPYFSKELCQSYLPILEESGHLSPYDKSSLT